MKLKTISATYDRKINMGNYESTHIAMTLWADLEEGDDPELAGEALRQMARHHVMVEMARIRPELQAKIDGVFMGLPAAVQKEIVKSEGVQE